MKIKLKKSIKKKTSVDIKHAKLEVSFTLTHSVYIQADLLG